MPHLPRPRPLSLSPQRVFAPGRLGAAPLALAYQLLVPVPRRPLPQDRRAAPGPAAQTPTRLVAGGIHS
jgi:hypothetical protein